MSKESPNTLQGWADIILPKPAPKRAIILVGEANPYGTDPSYALYPLPERASGDRLCTLIMGLDRHEYLRRFERVNLCPMRWSIKQARVNAEALRVRAKAEDVILVLLGAKVHTAFDWAFNPFTVTYLDPKGHYVSLPHPSGLSRAWNEPGSIARARAVLVEAGVLNG